MRRWITVLATASLLMVAMAAPAAAGTRQTSEIYTFADLPALVDVGDAAVVRNANGVTVQATSRSSRPQADPCSSTTGWVLMPCPIPP